MPTGYERRVANRGRNKGGNHGFRGRPSHHWMVVSIQASVRLTSTIRCKNREAFAFCIVYSAANRDAKTLVSNR